LSPSGGAIKIIRFRAPAERHIGNKMGRRIYIVGLGSTESAPHSEELTGLLQPPYSIERFKMLRDRVWASFGEEGVDYLGDLEMEEVLAIESTNAANVFIEEFHNYFPNLNQVYILSDSEGTYWVEKESMINFLDHLLALCEVFHQQAYGLSCLENIDLALDPETEKELLERYEQQLEKREDDPEAYEGKWGLDYFNFSLLGSFILRGMEIGESYPFFMVFDA
jgi:hypothetical protein